jgi:hypothetical protein
MSRKRWERPGTANRQTFNQRVDGSIPSGLTNKNKDLAALPSLHPLRNSLWANGLRGWAEPRAPRTYPVVMRGCSGRKGDDPNGPSKFGSGENARVTGWRSRQSGLG